MTREEFIEELDKEGYSYKIEGDKLVVTGGDKDGIAWLGSVETLPPGVEFRNKAGITLQSLKTLPPGVVFNNKGSVNLKSLKTLPPDVDFKNGGHVDLESLETIPPGVNFNNRGDIDLRSLKTLPPDVEFKNEGDVNLSSLVGSQFERWKGNIEGIAPNTLLNGMIKRGIFT